MRYMLNIENLESTMSCQIAVERSSCTHLGQQHLQHYRVEQNTANRPRNMMKTSHDPQVNGGRQGIHGLQM